MGQLHRVIAAGALLCACSEPPSLATHSEGPAPRAKAALVPPVSDQRFDAEGNLKPGSLKVGWFEIPLGFERQPGSTERSAIYEADRVTVPQLRNYVTARARPEHVQYMRNGEIYQRAQATHTQLPLPAVDVTVIVVDTQRSRLRLVVDDLTPTAPAMSPAQAMEALAKARDHME